MPAWGKEEAELNARHIGREYQARLRGARYVDVAAPQTSRDMGGDVRVKMMLLPNVPGAAFLLQAEDGIRDYKVTGVQTCALPIYRCRPLPPPPPNGSIISKPHFGIP